MNKTKIEKRLRKKKNPELVETIIKLKKTNPEIAKMLASPKRKWVKINLERIEKECKNDDKILVPGKVLSSGNLSRKIKIVAWSISEKGKEKLKESKSEFIDIIQELKKNPKLKDLKVLK